MGLDMYLRATRYVSGYDHSREDRPLFNKLKKLFSITLTEEAPSFTVNATVGYWRKANAIHAWFVKNCQGGEDECQDSYVSREQLQELAAACKQVLDTVETVPGMLNNGKSFHPDGRIEQHTIPGEVVAQAGVAAKVLPTQEGFFFGCTDYNEWYLDDLRETVKIVEAALALPDDWEFEYHASW